MAVCKRCGAQLADGSNFCTQCGLRVTADEATASNTSTPAAPSACPNCGAPAAAGSSFCTQCGKPLSPASGGEGCSHAKGVSPDSAEDPQMSAELKKAERIFEASIAEGITHASASRTESRSLPTAKVSAQGPASGGTHHIDKRAIIAISFAGVLIIAALLYLIFTFGQTKSSDAIPSPAETEELESASENDCGYYILTSIITNGREVDASDFGKYNNLSSYYISLYSNGSAEVNIGEKLFNCTWEPGMITSAAEKKDIPYTVKNGTLRIDKGNMTMVFSRTNENPARPQPNVSSSESASSAFNTNTNSSSISTWGGTWYGYWTIYEPTGAYSDMEFYCYDCCVDIEYLSGNKIDITMYDELCESDEYVFSVTADGFSASDGTASAYCSGYSFFGIPQESTLFIWDNSASVPNQLLFDGEYTDADGSFTYFVVIRPWGTLWDDEFLPYYYDSWYLPLIDAGRMPTDVVGVLD